MLGNTYYKARQGKYRCTDVFNLPFIFNYTFDVAHLAYRSAAAVAVTMIDAEKLPNYSLAKMWHKYYAKVHLISMHMFLPVVNGFAAPLFQ